MPNQELLAHIRAEFARGVNKTTLTQSLLSVGWKIEDIDAAMSSIGPAPSQNIPSVPRPPMTPTQPAYLASSSPQSQSMKAAIQNIAAGFFIGCVSLLTLVSIMGVWSIFSDDVIAKSFQTLGLLAFVAVIVIVASKFVGDPSAEVAQPTPRPGYRAIRNITLATLIASSAVLALMGVLVIWDVIRSSEILNKSLSSLGIIAFSSLIIVLVCLEREQTLFWRKYSKGMSWGSAIGFLILLYILFSFFRFFR